MTQHLVWINQCGRPTAQVWRDEESARGHYAPSAPRGYCHEQVMAKHAIAPEDEALSVSELAKKYPVGARRG